MQKSTQLKHIFIKLLHKLSDFCQKLSFPKQKTDNFDKRLIIFEHFLPIFHKKIVVSNIRNERKKFRTRNSDFGDFIKNLLQNFLKFIEIYCA